MNAIDQIAKKIINRKNLTKVTPEQLKSIRLEYPGIPEEYLYFLGSIGYGNIGILQVYSGPVDPNSVFPKAIEELSSIHLIGDDAQGFCYGFNPKKGWVIVEVSPCGDVDTTMTFEFLSLLNTFI